MAPDGLPRVSIGLPVFNGAETIATAIEALLGQTFEDFELIVVDNASTDGTPDIVRSFARSDRRIRYERNPVNLGVNANYTRAARLARGDYLKWASASDWCHPTFVERCLGALESTPGAVLAVTRTRLFQGHLAQYEDYPEDLAAMHDRPLERLRTVIDGIALNNAMNGVIRMSVLRSTPLIERYYRADLVLLGHLALRGKFVLLDDRLLYRRWDPESATARDRARKAAYHFPTSGPSGLLQAWRRQLGWCWMGLSAPLTAAERARVLSYLARRAVLDRREMLRDVPEALRWVALALMGRKPPPPEDIPA